MTGGGRRWRLVRASSDAVPASLRRFMSRRANTRRPAGRVAPWAAIVAVLVASGLLGWLLLGSSVLGVEQVRVTGAQLLTPAQVREAARVADETPLLRVDRGAVAGRVGALAPVADVAVSRDWPRTLVIQVVERSPVAVLPDGDGVQLVDRDGVLFHRLESAPPELPALELTNDYPDDHDDPDDQAGPGPDDSATRAALTVLAALPTELRAELETLVVAGPARIRLELRSGMTVVWGDESASDEKARVTSSLLTEPVGEEQVIDVSVPELVVLR